MGIFPSQINVQSLWVPSPKFNFSVPGEIPEGLDVKFTRHETGKTRHLGVFSRQNRGFSRHKQISSPSGEATRVARQLGGREDEN